MSIIKFNKLTENFKMMALMPLFFFLNFNFAYYLHHHSEVPISCCDSHCDYNGVAYDNNNQDETHFSLCPLCIAITNSEKVFFPNFVSIINTEQSFSVRIIEQTIHPIVVFLSNQSRSPPNSLV